MAIYFFLSSLNIADLLREKSWKDGSL